MKGVELLDCPLYREGLRLFDKVVIIQDRDRLVTTEGPRQNEVRQCQIRWQHPNAVQSDPHDEPSAHVGFGDQVGEGSGPPGPDVVQRDPAQTWLEIVAQTAIGVGLEGIDVTQTQALDGPDARRVLNDLQPLPQLGEEGLVGIVGRGVESDGALLYQEAGGPINAIEGPLPGDPQRRPARTKLQVPDLARPVERVARLTHVLLNLRHIVPHLKDGPDPHLGYHIDKGGSSELIHG